MLLYYSDSEEDDRSSKQSKNENFKDSLDFLDKDNQLETILSDDNFSDKVRNGAVVFDAMDATNDFNEADQHVTKQELIQSVETKSEFKLPTDEVKVDEDNDNDLLEEIIRCNLESESKHSDAMDKNFNDYAMDVELQSVVRSSDENSNSNYSVGASGEISSNVAEEATEEIEFLNADESNDGAEIDVRDGVDSKAFVTNHIAEIDRLEKLNDTEDLIPENEPIPENELNSDDCKNLPAADVAESAVTETPIPSENLIEEPMVIESEEMSTSDFESKLTKRKFDVGSEAKRKRYNEDLSNIENICSASVITDNSKTIAATNSLTTETCSTIESHMNKKGGKEDDDDVLLVGEIKQPDNSLEKRSASLTEIYQPVRKAKVFILNTQAIANNLCEETNAEKIVEVSSVITEKDPEPSYEQYPSIQRKVANQEESNNQSEPTTHETPSIQKAQNTSDEKTETEKILTLNPPPRKPLCPSAFSLNFVRKFRKNFDKMNRNDLEELLIQKCVEAIVHKSDDADLRNRVETQDNKLQSYRIKYQELSKQYRDLEMLHQRVVKDLEAKNQSVVMPLKITRAVGLQVCLPRTDIAVPKPSAPLSNAPPTAAQNDAAANRNRQKVSPQRPNYPNTYVKQHQQQQERQQQQQQERQQQQQQQQQIIKQNMLGRRPAISLQQCRQFQQEQQQQTQNSILKQQLMQNNSTAFKPQANFRRPAELQFSASSLNQINHNSSCITPGSAKQPRIPPIILKKLGNQGRTIYVTSSNSATENVYNSQSKLENKTIVPSSVPATATTTTINNIIDLTDDDEDSNVVTNGTRPPHLVAILTKATAPQSKMTEQNAPQSTIQIVPQNRMMQNIGNNYVSFAPKNNDATQKIVQLRKPQPATTLAFIQRRQHPAPLPLSYSNNQPSNPLWKYIPPRPIIIRINKIECTIVILWTMDEMTDKHAEVEHYQIYAYQETSGEPSPETWQHVGNVKAMLLPMAVTLTQFQEGQRYHFAVRAVDKHSRYGIFSLPKTWT